MLAALRSRLLLTRPWNHHRHHQNIGFPLPSFFSTTATSSSPMDERLQFLNLEEVEKVLSDVKADDVRVIPVKDHCDWTDYMVVATGRSTWHVRNIAQALIHKASETKTKRSRPFTTSQCRRSWRRELDCNRLWYCDSPCS
ncbi:protein Iojap-related, mitochondrial [Iris pallida]|uniref:Protein Iojap-related, mitochondrial n=1 Tax=Iris pallida TaxID=29817 RepID=A0AAX6HLQ4_IRIPA|nr:protein Iojap-related, mitochondrial [Iris pallida]